MTEPESVIREALGHVEYPAEEFLLPALAALAALVAERDAAIAAVGEPCAECGHIDWRSDPNPLLERLAQAVTERDRYRNALQKIANGEVRGWQACEDFARSVLAVSTP